MTVATGIGSMPGEDQPAFDEAVRIVLDSLPDLPHLPEVPGRGAAATMTGRGLAVVSGLGADLQPAGWRLTDASGVDHRRAKSLLAQDLDTLEELTDGYVGAFKIQLAGPWTLAATVEKPRGDKVLSDHGARRDLAQALAEGLTDHVRDVRRRLPGVERLVVQIDEPALSAVLDARIPTASGFGRHRAVHPPEASEALGWVLAAIAAEDAEPWVHTCAPGTPLALLRGAGARGLSVDLSMMTAADHDALAEALEAGETVALGVVPSVDPATEPTDTEVTERVLRWLDMLGLDPGERLVLTPTCGLAGASPAWARQALALARTSAAHVSG
ncbi:methionine synthase [Nocardioides sp. CN2-186]|uniref:methionine synthase n=1 Tax=Nocardioides tweenelious TaxID=3156607 RepID=UPI0032B3F7D3